MRFSEQTWKAHRNDTELKVKKQNLAKQLLRLRFDLIKPYVLCSPEIPSLLDDENSTVSSQIIEFAEQEAT